MQLSIVVPVYNEEENLRALCEEVSRVMTEAGISYELILVDDGSRDRSWAIIDELATSDEHLRAIRLRRNFGQTAAMSAGFAAASGVVVVPMDADLQNDPADIQKLLEQIDNGYDVASGWRRDRQDRWLSRKLPSRLANALISHLTGVRLHDYGCTLKAYRRELLDLVNLYGELHRFVPVLASMVGAKVTEVAVNHRPRVAGVSKYGIDRTLRVVLDLITVKFLLRYATRPMQLFGRWALWSLLAGGAAGATTLYMKFFEHLQMNRNPLTVLTAFLIFSAVQFIALGLLGELVTRTWHETQNKPIYTIGETRNLTKAQG